MQIFIGDFLAVVKRTGNFVGGGEILGETWEDTAPIWGGAVFRLLQLKFGAENCFDNVDVR